MKALHAGMVIWFANGTKGTVEDISNEGLAEPVAVYNFRVEDFHTYFVGDSGVLVHNADCGGTYQTYTEVKKKTTGTDQQPSLQEVRLKTLVTTY